MVPGDTHPLGKNLSLLFVGALVLVLLDAWAGAHIDYHRLRVAAWPLAIVSVTLLILVLLPHFGIEVNGARRWLRLGPLQMQPAELAKSGAAQPATGAARPEVR